MIFTFPAIVSENVDQRLLPGITKSLEQYYLHHMVSALSTGAIRPYIDVDSTGHASSIKMESLDFFDGLGYIQENDIDFVPHEHESGLTPEEIADMTTSQKPREEKNAERERLDNQSKFSPTINIQIPDKDKDKDKDKKDGHIGIGPKVDLKTPPGLGFVPTMTTVEISIWIRDRSILANNRWQLQNKAIVIGVKVIPIVARNFNSMYQVLRDDYYANTIRYLFKGASRAIIRTLYSNAITRKIRRWYELGLGRSAPDELGSSPLDWYFSILLSPKALLNAGGFSPETSGLSYRQFTSAIAIMNKDEKEDLFENPSRLQRLFNMGWNSFLICDDRSKRATFCSNLDRGRCTMLPYSFIMTSIKGENIYKSYEDLEKASGGFFRHMKTSSLNIQKVMRESYVDSIYKKYSITEGKKKVNESLINQGFNVVEHGGKAIIDGLLDTASKYLNNDDFAKLKNWIQEKIPRYGTFTVLSIVLGYVIMVTYKARYAVYVDKCAKDVPTIEGKKLCILKAKIDAHKETLKLLNTAKVQCSKMGPKRGDCNKKFDDRIHKVKDKINSLQYKMGRG